MTIFAHFTQNMMQFYFSTTSTLDTPTFGLPWKKKLNTNYPFLDVLVDNSDPNSLLTRVYCKKTFTRLLTNYFSFTSYSYKVGLIRTLVDRAYKINNTWLGLHEDLTKPKDILKKNLFPAHFSLPPPYPPFPSQYAGEFQYGGKFMIASFKTKHLHCRLGAHTCTHPNHTQLPPGARGEVTT